MLRQVLTVVTVVLAFGSSLSAQDSDWDRFWARYRVDRARNEAWPQPFLHYEQQSIRNPFAAMVQSGWQVQNTLTEHHFDPETHELNSAGLHMVQTVIRESPEAHRTIFVYTGFNPEETAERMASVRTKVGAWVPENMAPAIVMTTRRPRGIPGSEADSLNRAFQDALPTPSVPVATGGSAGSGGGGGGSN